MVAVPNDYTMDFAYSNYNVRFVRNATDSILRLDDKSSHKLFEITITDRDFLEYTPFGGIDFISNIIASGLQDKDGSVVKLAIEKEALTLSFTYAIPLVLKPVAFSLKLPAIRRVAATEDTEVLMRRLRDLEAKFIALEDRAGSIVSIGGGGPPCPIDATSVSICLSPNAWNQGAPNGAYKNSYGKEYFHMSIYTGNGKEGIDSVKGFEYLTNCTSLILSGFKGVRVDFTPLGKMTSLQTLRIISETNHTGNNPEQMGGYTGPAYLTDISWITNLKQLTAVSFYGCTSLSDITPLKELPNLTSVIITKTAVTNTDWLSVSKPKCVITK